MKSRVFKPPQGEVSTKDILDVIDSQKNVADGIAGLDSNALVNLANLPIIPRSQLEYPTEDVSFAYLLAIDKAKHTQPDNIPNYPTAVTVDSFTDKAIAFVGIGERTSAKLRVSGSDYYMCNKDVGLTTEDFIMYKYVAGTTTSLAYDAVDLNQGDAELVVFSISGSTLSGWLDVSIANIPSTAATISATDTDIASGQIGAAHGWSASAFGGASPESRIYAPFSPLPKAKSIIEIDNLIQDLAPIPNNAPDFLKQNIKKYNILKSKGFTDEEIKELFPNLKTHIDKSSVTWGAFDHKKEHNTKLAIITGGNPYTGDDAISKQIEHAKSKNLIVMKPPKDYQEAIEQHKQLKQHFPEWIAGKDNYAYQVLGHEAFECFQVADTYYGRIVDMEDTKAYKNVPDWELRRTLEMWKDRLNKVNILAQEKEKHLKKLNEVEKKGW